jgi:hypothetical protein
VKRLILLALVLAIGLCNTCFAEEETGLHTHTYTGSWVMDFPQEVDGVMKELTLEFYYTFETSEVKQPLIFEGTDENPKTGFSYMSIEEINQLRYPEVPAKILYDGDKVHRETYIETDLKKALLSLEKLFEYKELKDGTIQKGLRIKTLKKTSKPTPNDSLYLSVRVGNQRILYEQLCYIFIEYFVPYTVVNTAVEGSSLEKIERMYLGNTPAQELNLLYWIPNKPAKRIEADKAYIRDALLNVSEEDFNRVLGFLEEQFDRFLYIDKDGQAYIGTAVPSSRIKKMYGIK